MVSDLKTVLRRISNLHFRSQSAVRTGQLNRRPTSIRLCPTITPSRHCKACKRENKYEFFVSPEYM